MLLVPLLLLSLQPAGLGSKPRRQLLALLSSRGSASAEALSAGETRRPPEPCLRERNSQGHPARRGASWKEPSAGSRGWGGRRGTRGGGLKGGPTGDRGGASGGGRGDGSKEGAEGEAMGEPKGRLRG